MRPSRCRGTQLRISGVLRTAAESRKRRRSLSVTAAASRRRRRQRVMASVSKTSNSFALLSLSDGLDDDVGKDITGVSEDLRDRTHRGECGGDEGPSGLVSPIVWIDCEMTGLDPERHQILQIAVLVTDGRLGRMEVGPEITIHCNAEALDAMDEWCTTTHGRSGLSDAARASDVTLRQAEQAVLAFVKEHAHYRQANLAGNSVYVDLNFIRKYMPELFDFFDHRLIDVSSIALLYRRWQTSSRRRKRPPKKKGRHTALSDIMESVEELRFYRRNFFSLN